VKTLRICVIVQTQYRRVTDSQTDGQTDEQTDILPRHSPRYAYASRSKTIVVKNVFYVLYFSIKNMFF